MNNQGFSDKQNITNHMAFLVGGSLGLLSGLALLSGDDAGRVNILFLLLLFVVVPVTGILLLAFSTIGKGISVHLRINEQILFLGKQSRLIRSGHSYAMQRLLLLYHSQYGGVGWACGSIVALLTLLLFTDINFVWRSTLLTPETLLPVLEVIAFPWFFWEAAQPSNALLTATQDSRLAAHQEANIAFSQWWPFILACLIFYSFLLRSAAMLLLRGRIQKQLRVKKDTQKPVTQTRKVRENLPAKALEEQLPDNVSVVNWAGFDENVIAQMNLSEMGKPVLVAGPLASDEQNDVMQKMDSPQLLLVKAWEPPLEELRDYLVHCKGMIAPIDIKAGKVVAPQQKHVDEWNRSISDLPDWKIYIKRESK